MGLQKSKLSILVVEDNVGDFILLEEYLRMTSMEFESISHAKNLSNGIEFVAQKKPDVIFLDLFLPDSKGIESFYSISKKSPHIPVIILSGLNDTSKALEAISGGAQDYLIKGEFSSQLLQKSIQYSIERKSAEERILLSERRFKSLVQNSADLLSILDMEGNYIYVSPTSKNILGFEPEFFIGKSTFAFIHKDDIQKTTAILASIATKKLVKAPLFRFRNALGEWRWIESTVTNLMDDPAISGIVINSRDVTDKKIADDEIERLSLIATKTLSGVFILDKNKKIQWVNDAFTKITEFTLLDALGKKPSELLYGKNPSEDLFADVREHLSKGIHFEGERLNYTKSGKPIWIWLQLQILFDKNGDVKQYFAIQTDITEKKFAEDELQKLSIIAKETSNGVVIRDKDQKVIWINNAFKKMYGYELEEIIGKNPIHFLPGSETDEVALNNITENLNLGNPFIIEIEYYTKSKNKIHVHIQAQPIFDEEGNLKQTFALHTDITEKKLLEKQVETEKIIKQKEITDAVFAAQESERSEIGRELHDNVNQLLGATRLYIDMAKREEEDRDTLLNNASTFTLNAIEEIRKLSKTLITPLIKEIGLADSIKDLAEEIMLVHPVKIIFAANNLVDDTYCDKLKLNIFRIVQEQINNILKHAKAKNITIQIEDNDESLSVSIADNGIGFDTTAKKKGVGITNIKSRVELYNGTAALTSEPGKGTQLLIHFYKADLLKNSNHYHSN